MNKDKILKEIDCQRDIKNHLWNALVLSLAGSLGLLFANGSLLRNILIITGFLSFLIFANGYFAKDEHIKRMLNKLED